MADKHYVYSYLREDGTPYYIGKGKGNRAWKSHTRINGTELLPKDNSRIVILIENISEEVSTNMEIFLIGYYGRKDLGTGILRNMTDGGEGLSGHRQSEESRKKNSDSQIKIRQSMTKEERSKIFGSHGKDNPAYGKAPSDEQIERKRMEKLSSPVIECPHCKEKVDHMNYGRWHGDNCKEIAPRPLRAKKECPNCHGYYAINGIGQHMNKCEVNT